MNRIIIIVYFLSVANTLVAQKGAIQGRIYEEASNAPLPFSNIYIEGTVVGATSDYDGNFLITGLDAGIYRLTAQSLGYETTFTEEIRVSPGKTANINIAMRTAALQLTEVTVKASIFKKVEEAPVSLRSIGVSEIENNPGANRDISKVIQSFPGVAAFSGQNRNDIIVRGGASNESRFFLDDIEIPNINHFATQGASGGTNGIINADFIREVDFYSGAFPANRGNALSGVFNFKQIDGNKEDLRFRGSLGASEIALSLDGPLGERSTFLVSARRSYLQFLFQLIGLPFLPTFNDMQFKVKTRIDDRNEISFIGLASYDTNVLDTDIAEPSEFQAYLLGNIPESNQWTYALGAVYKHYRDNGYQTFVLSRNMLYNRSFKYFNNVVDAAGLISDYNSFEAENKMRLENFIQTNNGFRISYGINAEFVKYNNSTFRKFYRFDMLDTLDYSSSLSFFKYGASGQISRSFAGNRLTATVGLRTDANTYSAAMSNPLPQLSPRMSLTYLLSEKWRINANAGRYFQLPPYTSLGYRDSNGVLVNKTNNINYVRADHLIAGFEFRPSSTSLISIEGFYKDYANFPIDLNDSLALAFMPVDFGIVGDGPISSEATGRAYGFELLSQNRFQGNFSLVVSYTFSISEFADKNGNYIASSWDNRHVFNLIAIKQFKRNWSAGVKWRFAGGLPYTPYDIALSSQRAAWDIKGSPYFDYTNLNGERFRAFHQLDVRIDKVWNFKRSALKLYVDIQNAYNFKSQSQDILVNTLPSGAPAIDPMNPDLYILRALENDGSGTIVPTIGIIVDF